MRSRGQSVLYAVLLMPTLILIFAVAVDMAALQMERLRLQYAVDLATVTAATAVDAPYYSRTGRLELDPPAATDAAREYILRNLSGIPDIPAPTSIAAAAEISIINRTPAIDPYTGGRLDHPAVCARIKAPYRFMLLGWLGLNHVELSVAADAEIRT
jgi:2-oxoglutarate dehydrogenase complex dehydrogenase (E1) component-like enzyme